MFDRGNSNVIVQRWPHWIWIGMLPFLLLQALAVGCGDSSSPDPRTGVSMGGGGATTNSAGAGAGGAPVNDCSNGSVTCAPHATCVPAGAQYGCVCNDGFVGDGAVQCSVLTQLAVCGDKTCQASESCSTCPADCGVCPAVCGDGTCQASESCKTCSADCGACVPSCAGIDPGTECAVFPTCGCAVGSMCIPTTTSGSGHCVPAGTARAGDGCMTNADCAPGLGCNTTMWGQTIHVCGQIVADAVMSTCNAGTLGIDGTANEVSGLAVCGVDCDPAHPQSPPAGGYLEPCGPGVACRSASIGDIEGDFCMYPPGTTALGGACTKDSDCVVAAECVATQGSSTGACRKACSSNADCTGQPAFAHAPGTLSTCSGEPDGFCW